MLVDKARESLKEYDAILLVGGSGPIVDMANNQRVHDLILEILQGRQANCGGMLRGHLPRVRPRLV